MQLFVGGIYGWLDQNDTAVGVEPVRMLLLRRVVEEVRRACHLASECSHGERVPCEVR